MTNSKDVIIALKRVREEKNFSYSDIIRLMEENGDIPVSTATLSRIFSDGSEDKYFSYETTLRPLANVLLDVDTMEETDTDDVKGLKALLQYKKRIIEDLEKKNKELELQLDREKLHRHEQIDEVREQSRKSINFLKNQISYKDERMNEFSERISRLLDRLEKKDDKIEQLMNELIALKDLKEAAQSCPYRKEKECKNED